MLLPDFFFSSPYEIHLAPPLSPPSIKRKRPAPIPAKCYNTPHVKFQCEFLLPDFHAIWRNGRQRRNHYDHLASP